MRKIKSESFLIDLSCQLLQSLKHESEDHLVCRSPPLSPAPPPAFQTVPAQAFSDSFSCAFTFSIVHVSSLRSLFFSTCPLVISPKAFCFSYQGNVRGSAVILLLGPFLWTSDAKFQAPIHCHLVCCRYLRCSLPQTVHYPYTHRDMYARTHARIGLPVLRVPEWHQGLRRHQGRTCRAQRSAPLPHSLKVVTTALTRLLTQFLPHCLRWPFSLVDSYEAFLIHVTSKMTASVFQTSARLWKDEDGDEIQGTVPTFGGLASAPSLYLCGPALSALPVFCPFSTAVTPHVLSLSLASQCPQWSLNTKPALSKSPPVVIFHFLCLLLWMIAICFPVLSVIPRSRSSVRTKTVFHLCGVIST